jgi:putative ABC transport system permease protein
MSDRDDVRPPEVPAAMLAILEKVCPRHLFEGIAGDLEEQFLEDCRAVGEKRARRNYVFNGLRFLRPGIISRNQFVIRIFNTLMIRSYLVVAFRNILKNKTFSAINIFGLGSGLAVCLLIFQFVSFELSYDNFNEKLDRTYRITNDRFQNGQLIQHGTIMYPTIGPVTAREFPEIEEYTRLMPGGTMILLVGEKIFRGDQAHFVDERFLSVFSFRMLAGDRATCLKERYSLVVTESMARKLFELPAGDYANLIGRDVLWGTDPQPFRITGVLEDVPENSHITFNALVSYSSLISAEDHGADDSWTWSDMRHYLVLKPGSDPKALEAKFPDFSERHFQGTKVSGSIEKFYLQPMKEAHLYSDYEYDIAKRSSGKAVWAMMIVAVFILLIAWINYINLATSRALDRAREVGLRKVMGAVKSQLVRQFIFESVLISMIALILAVVSVQLAQGKFNQIIEGNLSWIKVFSEMDAKSATILVALMVVGILLSGFYPAFILSAYQPATVLKGKFQRSSGGQILRKGLVIFQFAASAVLITGTAIVSRQLSYMSKADLGIDISNTLIVQGPELAEYDSSFNQRVAHYKEALKQVTGVQAVATSNRLPGDRLGRAFGIRLTEHSSEQKFTLSNMGVDYSFFDAYGVKLVAGRNFSPTDHRVNFDELNVVILNENAVSLLGIPGAEAAVGKELIWGRDGTRKWTIIGVVQNFHQESMKLPMEPMVFRPQYSTYAPASIKFTTDDTQAVIAGVEKTFKEFFPGNAFQYSFLSDTYNRQYKDDTRFGKVITIFTGLGIIISCLGLIGLSSYTAAQRTKEIGIRKTLGATTSSIVTLLGYDFVKLVLLATLIALPIAWFAMDRWLQGYAYRITPGWPMFVVPVVIIIAIAALTVSMQVMKTAMTSPAETLKYE